MLPRQDGAVLLLFYRRGSNTLQYGCKSEKARAEVLCYAGSRVVQSTIEQPEVERLPVEAVTGRSICFCQVLTSYRWRDRLTGKQITACSNLHARLWLLRKERNDG